MLDPIHFRQNFGVLKVLKKYKKKLNYEIKRNGKSKLSIHQVAIVELSLGI